MITYTVVYERDQNLYPATVKASKTIEALLNEGWTPQGSHSIFYDLRDSNYVVSQALIKEIPTK